VGNVDAVVMGKKSGLPGNVDFQMELDVLLVGIYRVWAQIRASVFCSKLPKEEVSWKLGQPQLQSS
jgi:hypothetical protein